MSPQTKKEKSLRRRRRLRTKAADGAEYDVAHFEPERGLVMRKSDWPFYHADLSEHSDSSDDERVSCVLCALPPSYAFLCHFFLVPARYLPYLKLCRRLTLTLSSKTQLHFPL